MATTPNKTETITVNGTEVPAKLVALVKPAPSPKINYKTLLTEPEFRGWSRAKLAGLVYAIEPILHPALKFEGTPEEIKLARDGGKGSPAPDGNPGIRWERIVARTGLKLSEVERRYAQGSGTVAETSFCGRGRRFAEHRVPVKTVASPKSKTYLAAVKATRKSGVRGDQRVVTLAVERVDKPKTRQPKATPAK